MFLVNNRTASTSVPLSPQYYANNSVLPNIRYN